MILYQIQTLINEKRIGILIENCTNTSTYSIMLYCTNNKYLPSNSDAENLQHDCGINEH